MMSSSSEKLHADQLKLSFDAVFYYVTNMEASTAFYRNTLGLPLVSEDYVARFDLDGVLIELVPAPAGGVPGNGNARLCFAVTDLDRTVERLHRLGVGTSDILEKKGGRLAFFRDPDGNELSLWEYVKSENVKEIVESAVLHG